MERIIGLGNILDWLTDLVASKTSTSSLDLSQFHRKNRKKKTLLQFRGMYYEHWALCRNVLRNLLHVWQLNPKVPITSEWNFRNCRNFSSLKCGLLKHINFLARYPVCTWHDIGMSLEDKPMWCCKPYKILTLISEIFEYQNIFLSNFK